jgi:hypothetical protein
MTVLLAVLALIPGLPLALLLHRRTTVSWPVLLVEAGGLSLLWYLLVGLGAARLYLFDSVAILAPTLLVAAAVGLAAARSLPRIELPRPSLTLWLVLASLALGFYLRRDAIYFIYETDDMGEYVNRANRLALDRGLIQSFPHAFTVVLGLSRLALGPAQTVAVVPLLGCLFVALVPAITRALGMGPWTTVLATAVTAMHVVPVWFSRLPASEALYAPILLAGVYWLVTALTDGRSVPKAVVAGCFLGALMFVRGSALLLFPVLAAYLYVMAVSTDRQSFRLCAWTVGTAVAVLALGFAYNVEFVRPYFVHRQLSKFAGPVVFTFLARVGWLEASASLGAAALGGLGILLVTARAVNQRAATRCAPRIVLAGVVGAAIALLSAFPLGGLSEASRHFGPLVLGLASCGVIGLIGDPGTVPTRATMTLAILILAPFAALFAWQFREPLGHPVFLYYDRYLFSEVFPALFLLMLYGAHVLEGAARRLWARRLLRYVALPVAGAILVVGLIDLLRPTLAATSDVMYKGAYQQVKGLDRITRIKGEAPVAFSGFDTPLVGWIFPSTYRAFAVPLFRTFDRQLLNEVRDPFAPDPVLTPPALGRLLRRKGIRHAYLIVATDSRLAHDPEFRDGRHVRPELLGEVAMTVPILRRDVGHRVSPFVRQSLSFQVYWLDSGATSHGPDGARRADRWTAEPES